MLASNTPAEPRPAELHVQHIACTNNAWFVMGFIVQRLDGERVIGESAASVRFTAGRTVGVDLSALKFDGEALQAGDRVRLRVDATAGGRRHGPSVAYSPNGHTAGFSVRGTTHNISIDRI